MTGYYDPRDFAESKAELARDVLDDEELRDFEQHERERGRAAAAKAARRRAESDRARRAARARADEESG